MLSVIEDIEPRNVIEGMLAAQLAILHVSSMGLGRRARHGSLDSENVKLLTKVSKTFASLADTLQRLRNGGTQNLTVGHVSVSQGGQAIVSNNLLSRSSDGADANSPGPPQSSKKEDDPACEDDSASSDQG